MNPRGQSLGVFGRFIRKARLPEYTIDAVTRNCHWPWLRRKKTPKSLKTFKTYQDNGIDFGLVRLSMIYVSRYTSTIIRFHTILLVNTFFNLAPLTCPQFRQDMLTSIDSNLAVRKLQSK